MNNITRFNQQNRFLSDYFYLAEASYADFSQSKNNFEYNDDGVRKSISNKKEDGGIEKPTSLADLLIRNYKVIAHWKDRKDESGFSGTLFKGKNGGNNPGKYVLALKGTAGLQDLLTDGGDVGADGLAHHQIIDLYNFWQQITHKREYRVAKIVTDPAPRLHLPSPPRGQDYARSRKKSDSVIS